MRGFPSQLAAVSPERIWRAVVHLVGGAGKTLHLPDILDARIRNVGTGERPLTGKPGPRGASERTDDGKR